MRPRGSCLPLASLLVLFSTAYGQQRPVKAPHVVASLEECESLAARSSGEFRPYSCFYDWASATNQWDVARKRLEALLEKSPEDPWLLVALGDNQASHGDLERMLKSYKMALEGFVEKDDASGQAVAYAGIARYYQNIESLDQAEEQLRLAESASVLSGDELLHAEVELAQVWPAFRKGDLSRASVKVSRAERRFREAVPEGERWTRRQLRFKASLSNALGAVYWALVKPEEAIEAYRAEADALRLLGDSYNASTTAYNLALVAANNQRTLRLELADVVKQTEEALEAALRVGNTKNEMTSRLLLGNLLAVGIHASGGRDYRSPIKQVEKALALSRELKDEANHNRALQTLARLYLSEKPDNLEKPLQLFDEVLASAVERQSLGEIAFAHFYRSRWLFDAGRRELALEFGLKALDAIERMRDLQSDSATRIRLFSAWVERYRDIYYWLVHPDNGEGDRKSLDQAVSIIERMRARELLSELDRASATPELIPQGESAQRRVSILEEITRLQSRMLREDLSKPERSKIIEKITDLELDLRAVEQSLGRESERYKLVRTPDFASLEEVQRGLDDSEVVFSYQALYSTGSLLRITRSAADVFSAPSRFQLRDPVDFLAGLIQRRDDTEANGAEFLHHQLVGDALDDLPSTVKRLIVVPDAGLEKLPFGVLRESRSQPRLSEKYDIVVAPSLTAWLRWKKETGRPVKRQLLALADPILPRQELDDGSDNHRERLRAFDFGIPLNPLPRAREEGRSVINALAGNGRLVVGERASEQFVKQIEPGEYAVIHFASHAVVDEANPERTALLLTPGSKTEDGLLQVREIVNLNLDGQLVVLSACQTASGEVLSGEGVLSLARAFFVAGAHAVVGSLWPLRDDDAAAFFERFYLHLGEGVNAATALAEAQRDRIAAGAPAAAWAGLVVLGNGDLTPFPGGAPKSYPWWPLVLLMAGAVLGCGLVIRHISQRRKRRNPKAPAEAPITCPQGSGALSE